MSNNIKSPQFSEKVVRDSAEIRGLSTAQFKSEVDKVTVKKTIEHLNRVKSKHIHANPTSEIILSQNIKDTLKIVDGLMFRINLIFLWIVRLSG